MTRMLPYNNLLAVENIGSLLMKISGRNNPTGQILQRGLIYALQKTKRGSILSMLL
jgi:hypothetical protein